MLSSGMAVPQFTGELRPAALHIPLFLMRTWPLLCLEERLKMLGGCLWAPETQQSLATGQRQKERKILLKSSSKCYSQQAWPHILDREFRVTMDMC